MQYWLAEFIVQDDNTGEQETRQKSFNFDDEATQAEIRDKVNCWLKQEYPLQTTRLRKLVPVAYPQPP